MNNLRRIRNSRGLTMKALGEKVGVTESAIGLYELGKRKISSDMLVNLAEALKCSVTDIIGDASPYTIDEVETHDENGRSAGPEVTITLDDKDPDIAAMLALLDDFKNRADIRKLFEIAHNSTPEEVQQAAKIMEALRKE